jgi:general secretion pathway protein F
MPIFEYTALATTGKEQKGLIDAENIRAARQRLRTQGIFPTDMRESNEAAKAPSRDVKRFFQSNRVSTKELSISTRQLSTLVGAGLPLVNALSALGEQPESPVLKRIIIDVRERVEEGESLAKACGSFPKAFPPLYVNMIAAGEASGSLDRVLANLAEYLEAQLALQRRITSALMYPVVMLVICTLVVTGLLVYLVPRIVDMFIKQRAELPMITKIMVGISGVITHYWWLIILLLIGAVSLFRWYRKQPAGRRRIDMLLIRFPMFGRIYTKVSAGRIARTLGALLSGGVGLLNALEITRSIVQNVHFAEAMDAAKEGVREGRSLAKELSKSGLFPPMVTQMIAIGEKSGELEEMLDKTGKAYESEVNATLAGLTSLIEPLMLVAVGGIVFLIVISVLAPMPALMNAMQR